MTNLIIAYDNTEVNFERLAKNIKTAFIRNSNYCINEITHPDLNINNINSILNENKNELFIFVAFSHGIKNGLLIEKNLGFYAEISNSQKFNNSIFYTFSCSTGLNFSDALISNGCLAFYGYKGEVFFLNEPLFITANIDIVNSGLKNLIENQIFDKNSYENAKNIILDKYDQYIENEADLDFIRCWSKNLLLLVLKQK